MPRIFVGQGVVGGWMRPTMLHKSALTIRPVWADKIWQGVKTMEVNWVVLSEEKQHEILMAIRRPTKRFRVKKPQGAITAKRPRVDLLDEEPARMPMPEDMVEEKQEDGGEMVEKEEEGKARSRGYRWREWSPRRVRSFFKRNPNGETEGCEACRACGVSRSKTCSWYLSKKTGLPAGSWCKTCKIKRQMQRRLPQDVD
eukprot:s3772_g1.t1